MIESNLAVLLETPLAPFPHSRLHPQLWSRVENSVPYPCRSVI